MTKKILVLAMFIGLTEVGYSQESSTVWDGIYSAEQSTRGEAVYTQACLACHGLDLGGNSNSPGLVGMGFMFLWEGRSVGEFFEKIRSEMPTDRPGQLPVQDYLDVVAYVLQRNAFPQGNEQLPSDTEALDAIAIVPRP